MKTQQDECYAAEATVHRGKLFKSVADAQKFVDALRDTHWWVAQGYHLKVARIEVAPAAKSAKSSQGGFRAEHNAGLIHLTQHGLCVQTVLHEVAHVLSIALFGSQSHDPWWARTYLTLESCVRGPEAYLALQRAFDAHGVDYDVKTTPTFGARAL